MWLQSGVDPAPVAKLLVRDLSALSGLIEVSHSALPPRRTSQKYSLLLGAVNQHPGAAQTTQLGLGVGVGCSHRRCFLDFNDFTSGFRPVSALGSRPASALGFIVADGLACSACLRKSWTVLPPIV